MKELLTPEQWALHLNKYVKHSTFGILLLIGIRIKCDENNNLMLLVEDNKVNSPSFNEHFWVYDYQTEPLVKLNYQQ